MKTVKADRRIKFQILKELNQAPMGDIGAIYAELNQHLAKLKVLPAAGRPTIINRGGLGPDTRGGRGEGKGAANRRRPKST